MLFEQMRSMNSYMWLQEQKEKRKPSMDAPLAPEAPWRPRGAAAPDAFDVPKWHPEYFASPKVTEEDRRQQLIEEELFYNKEQGYLPDKFEKKRYRLPWRKVERIRKKNKQKEAARLAVEAQIEDRDGPAWRKSKQRY